MGATKNGALSGIEAAWALAERLEAGECLTLDDAARIVAGCGNGDAAAWYELTTKARSRYRGRARLILRAGVDAGAVRLDCGVWEIVRDHELVY